MELPSQRPQRNPRVHQLRDRQFVKHMLVIARQARTA